ncbi:unnamed protein product [Protopolystoma xenopodis]|uniref:Uncharacterized protein n=1 Tax=Protopolystoma xenopodis TaxID=117903 RepID=A0A3S5B5G2_9PLAT|nr:unnamed protein product [Protopolystoma xenopodis]
MLDLDEDNEPKGGPRPRPRSEKTSRRETSLCRYTLLKSAKKNLSS